MVGGFTGVSDRKVGREPFIYHDKQGQPFIYHVYHRQGTSFTTRFSIAAHVVICAGTELKGAGAELIGRAGIRFSGERAVAESIRVAASKYRVI